MPNNVLQIIKGVNIVASVGTPEEVTAALQHAEPGRYVVEESSKAGKLLPSDYSCQRWGIAILQLDGAVELEPELPPIRRREAAPCHGSKPNIVAHMY